MSKRKKRKFRLYYKAHHKNPAVIVEEDGTNAAGYVVTHSKKAGHNTNLPLKTNPQKGDATQSYLSKQRRKGAIGVLWSRFYLEGYELSDSDESVVDGMEKRRALRLRETQVNVTPSGKTIPGPKPKGKKKRRKKR